MLDIDSRMPVPVENIVSIIIAPFPMYDGRCTSHSVYTPSFPFIVNKLVFCYPCGNCITDIIVKLRERNPSIRISDFRKVLYN